MAASERANDIEIPDGDLTVRFSRSSGPGGQNVNVRDTRVELVFDFAGTTAFSERQKTWARARLGTRIDARGRIRVVSGAARTQGENRALALTRLRALLAEACAPPPRARQATKPTRGARERRLSEKKARGTVKQRRRAPVPDTE